MDFILIVLAKCYNLIFKRDTTVSPVKEYDPFSISDVMKKNNIEYSSPEVGLERARLIKEEALEEQRIRYDNNYRTSSYRSNSEDRSGYTANVHRPHHYESGEDGCRVRVYDD